MSLSPNTTIAELLHQTNRPALIDCEGGWTLSHLELRELVDDLALGLIAAGVAPGDGVGVVMTNRAATVAAFLAIVRLGAVAMPVNPQLRRGEIEAIFADWPPRAVLVGPDGHTEGQAAADAAGTPVHVVSDDRRPVLEGLGRGSGELPSVDPDAVALLLHTSGTTSHPKAVPLRQRNLAASARAIAAGYRLGPSDRSYCLMPLFHIHGLVATTLAALAAGGCVVVPRSARAGALWPHVREHEISWFSAVPTILAKLPEAPGGDPGSLRFARSCSSALPPQLWTALEERFRVPLVEAYGMTEASHQMATNRLPPEDRRAGSVGVATGTEIRILDAGWNALPTGEAGEVAVRGAGVVDSYLANPEANAASFRDGWFRTGDLGRLSADGHLTLEGRLKELINRGGEKIAPREIDEALLDHPGVLEAVAYGVADAKWGEVVHAAVVASGSVSAEELRAFCADRLAPFKVPRRLHVVDAIPKGPTGKVQRTTLGAALDA